MAEQITTRGVPEEASDREAERAELQRLSRQAYLRAELERAANQPSIEEWLKAVRARKAAAPREVPASVILRAIEADRM